jgi:hypothetical protein
MECHCLISREKSRSWAGSAPRVGKTILPSESHFKPGIHRSKEILSRRSILAFPPTAHADTVARPGGIGRQPLRRTRVLQWRALAESRVRGRRPPQQQWPSIIGPAAGDLSRAQRQLFSRVLLNRN